MVKLVAKRQSEDRTEDSKSSYLISPVQRAAKVLEFLANGGSTANLAEAARQLGMNRITLARLLDTLAYERLVERTPDGASHRLGARLFAIAAATFGTRDLLTLAVPILRSLANTLRGSAYLGVLDGGDVLYLLGEMPDSGLVSYVKVGSKIPAHLTSVGRILLAFRDTGSLQSLLGEEPLAAKTDKSAVTYAALEAQLAEARRRGCEWSLSTFEPGINSCAAPVRDGAGRAVAAISVNGPSSHFGTMKKARLHIEATLKVATQELSALLRQR